MFIAAVSVSMVRIWAVLMVDGYTGSTIDAPLTRNPSSSCIRFVAR